MMDETATPHGFYASRSAGDRAYEWIRSAILSGMFAEGQFLDEIALSEAVQTSRTPVRQALHRLQAERFVDIAPRRGAQVRTVNATEMAEVYQIRLVLESHALRTICERGLGPPPGAKDLIASMKEAGHHAQWNACAQLDQSFHSSLVEHAGNGVLLEVYQTLRPRHVRLAVRTLTEGPERVFTIDKEHLALLSALETSDSSAALNTLTTHLRARPGLVQAS